MMVCGVYKLNFNGTDKVYVGQSVNCKARLSRHIREMKASTNSVKLNNAFTKFGTPTMTILEVVSPSELNILEDRYIQELECVSSGFNSAKHPGGGCCLSGDSHPNAQYSNEEILSIVKYILDNPSYTLLKISTEIGISNSIISHILRLDRHTWIEKEHPELWEELRSLKVYKSRGEAKGASKHKNSDILTVFNILVDCPDISYKEIAEFTSVSLDTINAIAKGTSFKWLEEEFPEKYNILRNLKGTRSRHKEVGSRISAEALGLKYPDVLSPDNIRYKVSNISAFAREFNLDKSSLHKLLQGSQKVHKGWKTCPEEQV